MNIEKIKKKHFQSVIKLVSQLSEFEPKTKQLEKIWSDFSKQKNCISLIVLKNDKVVGYGYISINMTIRGGRIGYIEDIICDKDYRKKGIGKALINELLYFAKKKNCYKVVLQCNKININFYKNCGFYINGSCMQKIISN